MGLVFEPHTSESYIGKESWFFEAAGWLIHSVACGRVFLPHGSATTPCTFVDVVLFDRRTDGY